MMLTRYIAVNYETRNVLSEAFVSDTDAWRAIVERCKNTDSAPNEWDIISVETEVR